MSIKWHEQTVAAICKMVVTVDTPMLLLCGVGCRLDLPARVLPSLAVMIRLATVAWHAFGASAIQLAASNKGLQNGCDLANSTVQLTAGVDGCLCKQQDVLRTIAVIMPPVPLD